MITKLKSINNLAVFQNFVWNNSVVDSAGRIENFKNINIIYGRNYSGKTTLTRIVRALETGKISDKYVNPEFELCFNDNVNVTHHDLTNHGKNIRVFNEDFIKEKLRFLSNSEDSISPFAILGDNVDIEVGIKKLKQELGENKIDEESGLYLDLKNSLNNFINAKNIYETEYEQLNRKLKNKAINNPDGIKYKSHKFGDQNYNINKLQLDIKKVLDPSYSVIKDEEVISIEELLKERKKEDIRAVSRPDFSINLLSEKAKILITKPISNSNKIEQLVKDSIMNRWVKEGRQLHKNISNKCSFCGNIISQTRWNELDSHFDEESEKLENEIEKLINEINNTIANLKTTLPIDKDNFYSSYHSDINRLIKLKSQIVDKIIKELDDLIIQLNKRKDDVLNEGVFSEIFDYSIRLKWCWDIFEKMRLAANSYSNKLKTEQDKSKILLRLKEVFDFLKTIQYENEISKIDRLRSNLEAENKKKEEVEEKIKNLIVLINDKERLLKDEENGALKVNDYLNNFFGHNYLSLQALEEENQIGDKKIKFEVIRDGKKAYHLSEGECNLIAFCYFMAKLEDIDTMGIKPIIWIDDPISSLDSNHIFFIYSLINSEIVSKENYEQLFISTHNLDFLKYLKRLPGASDCTQRGYFIISRENEISNLEPMPKYLKNYVTEFNYLFHQIYLCANANAEDVEQHSLYYNFGNNARKFLEAFLFYKYPNAKKQDDKLSRFFGDNHQASSMTERINNEFSHLEGLFERSMKPIDIPEMKKTASFILKKIKEKDIDQYEALLSSIGVESSLN